MDDVEQLERYADTHLSPDLNIIDAGMTSTGSTADTNHNDNGESPSTIDWTPGNISLTILLMGATGFFEIMGGWLIWMAVRGNQNTKDDGDTTNGSGGGGGGGDTLKKPWWFAILGGVSLIVYGFLPTLQPTGSSFGRIYAVYGGFFIVLSFLFGWALDGDRPDLGDVVGGSISLVGVLLVLFWPRG